MRQLKTFFILTFLSFILFACQPLDYPTGTPVPPGAGYECLPQNTARQFAQLVRVIDGDTIEVQVDGQNQRVRYIGMDTPERDETFYSEATAANQQLLAEGSLLLVTDVSETDQYGRLLRYVFNDVGVFVNYELVRSGFAYSATFPPDVACAELFLEAQTQAREEGAGLWDESLYSEESP